MPSMSLILKCDSAGTDTTAKEVPLSIIGSSSTDHKCQHSVGQQHKRLLRRLNPELELEFILDNLLSHGVRVIVRLGTE